MNAQVDPILEYTWELEEFETANSTIVVPDDITTSVIFFASDPSSNDNYEAYFGNCQIIDGLISFNNGNQEFTFNQPGIPLGHCGNTEILDVEFLLYEEFLFDNIDQQTLLNPYEYAFRTEGNFIYLDITNSEGYVATYSAPLLSNESFESLELSIYPNPVTDQLHIETTKIDIQQVEIFDLNGKRILKLDHKQNINVSHLAKGLYFLKIKTENGSSVEKFIKA